jgi:hypothetical protein
MVVFFPWRARPKQKVSSIKSPRKGAVKRIKRVKPSSSANVKRDVVNEVVSSGFTSGSSVKSLPSVLFKGGVPLFCMVLLDCWVFFLLLLLYYALIYFSFQVTAVAKDHFGRLLSAGITVYLAMHVIINIGMMTGFLPITGVPLVMVTYGGSSIMLTMTAIGLLQSIYSRRFMF